MKKTVNDFKFSKSEHTLKHTKETLVKNELSLENIIASNNVYTTNISNFKLESNVLINKLNKTFQFYPNSDSKIEDDFIEKLCNSIFMKNI